MRYITILFVLVWLSTFFLQLTDKYARFYYWWDIYLPSAYGAYFIIAITSFYLAFLTFKNSVHRWLGLLVLVCLSPNLYIWLKYYFAYGIRPYLAHSIILMVVLLTVLVSSIGFRKKGNAPNGTN